MQPRALIPPTPQASDMDYFVEVRDGRFVVNCKPFLVSGSNQ